MNYSLLLQRSVDFDAFGAHPLPGLPGRARAAAGPLAHPDALGPRRGRRLRPAHDRRPVPEHAAPQVLLHDGVRRPPGRERRRPRSRRARSARACARRRSTPGAASTAAVLRHQADQEVPVTSGNALVGLGHRPAAPRAAARGAACKGTPPDPPTNTAPRHRGRPAPAHGARRCAAAVLGVPEVGRGVHRRAAARSPATRSGWTGP